MMEAAAGIAKAAFAALKEWPLVQGAVAIFVLVFAALLARGALKERLPQAAPQAVPPQAVPLQVESPWITQQIIGMHYELEQVKALLGVVSNKIDGLAKLLKRRERRKPK